MLAEKTNTAQLLIEKISAAAAKVNYVDDDTLSKALMFLESKGIPTHKHEDYKYCNLDAVLKKEFKNIEQKFGSPTSADRFKREGTYTIVVINGRYSPELSDSQLPSEVTIKSLSQLNATEKNEIGSLINVESDAFVALNTAFSSDGFYLHLGKNTCIEKPLHFIYLSASSTESFVNTRNFMLIDEDAQMNIIEEQVLSDGKLFTNYLSEKVVKRGAKLTTCTLQDEGPYGYSINTNQVRLCANAAYTNTTITLSGQVVRNNHNVELSGEYSEAHLYGLFSTSAQQLVDNHTLMDHRVPNCESNELYKGMARDKSTGVFNGKIFVRKDAQKTNAYQSSKNILLSDDATINTKPQLEIYANDVKCSHGTSTGKIDDNALFYLNARGIGKESARKMLLASFAQEVIDKIELETIKDSVNQKLNLF